MPRHALNTSVSVERTQAEIESLLRKYGVKDYGRMSRGDTTVIAFTTTDGESVRFVVASPPLKDFEYSPGGRQRDAAAQERARAQAERSWWRSFRLCIHAKLEVVEMGHETFDQAFMPYLVLPGGKSLWESVAPKLSEARSSGRPVELLRLTTEGG